MKIYSLSEELNDADVLDSAIEQIGRIVRVMERHPDPIQFREDDRIKPLIARLEALRTSLATRPLPLDEKAAAEQRRASQLQAQGIERALAFLRGSEVGIALASRSAAPEPEVMNTNVKSLVEGLKSSDTEVRRRSRTALASVAGPATTDELVGELVANPRNYRVKLGVASALYQSGRPVVIEDAQRVRAVVDLIGDDDVLVRKYASESLMKLSDPKTVKQVHVELNDILRDRAQRSPNAVFNAVAILGTWLRILPSNLPTERASIRSELTALKTQLQSEPRWSNTLALVEEMLRLGGSPDAR